VTAPLSGQVGQDLKDPADTIVYIGVPDVTATLAAVQQHGGTVHYPRFEVPGRVVLGVFKDPAGNRVGLVEMENGKPKIPSVK
jgi:predicted enzyme related to lactoylglutathione lyase